MESVLGVCSHGQPLLPEVIPRIDVIVSQRPDNTASYAPTVLCRAQSFHSSRDEWPVRCLFDDSSQSDELKVVECRSTSSEEPSSVTEDTNSGVVFVPDGRGANTTPLGVVLESIVVLRRTPRTPHCPSAHRVAFGGCDRVRFPIPIHQRRGNQRNRKRAAILRDTLDTLWRHVAQLAQFPQRS